MDQRLIHKSINRIYKDIHEIQINPLKGISVCMPDECDPFTLRSNILILEGIYKSILLHLIIYMPKNYPLTAPNLIIAPGQAFDGRFHHHVFGTIESGYKICIDLLNSGYFSEGSQTGWTPAYTLSTLLMQMQMFFAQHDLHSLPTTQNIQELRSQLRRFETEIKLTDGSFAKHSNHDPFPPVDLEMEQANIMNNMKEITGEELKCEEDEKENSDKNKRQKVYEKFQCSLTKNTLEESLFFVGYPVIFEKKEEFVFYRVLPEILSYDGYCMQKLDNNKKGLRTSMGEYYHLYFPLYINEGSFLQFKEDIFDLLEALDKKRDSTNINGKNIAFIPCFTNILASFFFLYQMKSIKANQKTTEAMTHILRLMVRIMDEMPKGFLEDLKANKIDCNIYCNTDNSFETVIYQIIMKHLFDLPNELLAGLIKEMLYQDFKLYFNEALKKKSLTFEHSDELYQFLNKTYNAIIFATHFSRKFIWDLTKVKLSIDSNFGVLHETEIENFLLEFIQIITKIKSFSQFFSYLNLNISNDIDSFYRVTLFKTLLGNSDKELFKKSCFLENIPWFLQLMRGFLETQQSTVEIFQYFKKDLSLAYKFKRILANPMMGKPEKLDRVPKDLLAIDPEIVQYDKFLGSQEFLYYLLYLIKDEEYGKNSRELLMEFNIHEKFAGIYSTSEEYKLWQSFDYVVRREITKIVENMKKKPHHLMGNLCYFLRIFEKNRVVLNKIKPLFNENIEQKNFKEFLIENILLNFKDYKEKMKHGVKGKYELRDIELMILLFSDDFKLLKSPETIQKCLEIELFQYLSQDSKEEINKIMDENDLLLPIKASNKIYEYLNIKASQLTSLEQIFRSMLKFNTLEEIEDYQLELLNIMESKINMRRGILEEELDFERLTTFAIEQKKSALVIKKIELISKYLKLDFPYKSLFRLFQDMTNKPMEILDKYSRNHNKSDRHLTMMLNEILDYTLYASKIIRFEDKLQHEVLEYIRIFDEDEEIEYEAEKNQEILSFLFYLKITGGFENYRKYSNEKFYRKFLKNQISILWDFQLRGYEGYNIEEIENFFKKENLLETMKKYANELNMMNFKFLVLWSLNEEKINEKKDVEIWENEVKKRVKIPGIEWGDVKEMMGEGKGNPEALIQEICYEIVQKFLKNLFINNE